MAVAGVNSTGFDSAALGALYSVPAPACDLFAGKLPVSPATWKNLGMDAYLTDLAETEGISHLTGNYLVNLMWDLGWPGYMCTTDNAVCSSTPLTTCGSLLNYQVVGYQAYMKNSEDVLDDILVQLDISGKQLFENLWAAPPQTETKFDGSDIAVAALNSAVGFIPIVGQAYGAIIDIVDATISALKDSKYQYTPITPNYQLSWANFLGNMQKQVNSAKAGIYNQSKTVTQSSAILTEVAANGTWFVPDNTGHAFNPSVVEVWPRMKQYFMSKVAMQGLKAQSVFLLSIHMDNIQPGGTCTQTAADKVASYFGSSAKGVAWCDGSQVVVPVVGYNNALYTPWLTLLENADSAGKPNNILGPSKACYPGLGSTNFNVKLYDSKSLNVSNPHTDKLTFDMTQPCAWAVPICDFTTFYRLAAKSKGFTDWPSYTSSDKTLDVAQYCAYQFGMVDAIKWCGQRSSGSRSCSDPWRPTKLFTLQ